MPHISFSAFVSRHTCDFMERLISANTYLCMGRSMGRLTVVIEDGLETEFRIKAVRRRMRLSKALEEAVKLWLEKDS